MKRIFTILIAVLAATQITFAGGIITNTNQSAQYVRLLSRNASTDIDAVYFNPAGLTFLDNGFHLSLNNQTLFQEKTITTTFPYLNNNTYIGDVTVPFFPSIFAVYKKDKLALSFGFGPNGGGGSAEYKTGLPSFEMPISMIPVSLTQSGIPTTAYSADIYFKGSSVFYGGQLNGSYKWNDHLSISAGVRLIYAKNTYEGYIHSIMINPTYSALGANGSMMAAPTFFTTLSTYLNAASTQAYSAATSMQPIIDANYGSLSFADAENYGILTSDQRNTLEAGLLTMGVTQDQIDAMTIASAQGTFNAYGAGYASSAQNAEENAESTSDMDVDATQKGMAITPILSANFNLLNKKLNIGIKYEFNTKLELTNSADADKDANGMFLNDSTFRNDIPAILAVGVEYKIKDEFRVSASWNHYFDKNANWNGKEKFVDKNLYEIALGLEYDLSKLVTISAGYMYKQTGVGQGYQTDMSFSLSSNTVGFGGRINVNDQLSIDLGALFAMFSGDEVNNTYYGISYKETFDQSSTDFAIGINYKF